MKGIGGIEEWTTAILLAIIILGGFFIIGLIVCVPDKVDRWLSGKPSAYSENIPRSLQRYFKRAERSIK